MEPHSATAPFLLPASESLLLIAIEFQLLRDFAGGPERVPATASRVATSHEVIDGETVSTVTVRLAATRNQAHTSIA